MPKQFDEILKKIRQKLGGKTNPRTKKKYTDSEVYAVAVSTYKKKYGKAPTKESSPSWYDEDGKEVRENVELNWNQAIEFDRATRTEANKPLIIKGTAVTETISNNGIKYVSEELNKSYPSLKGKPIVNTHNHDDVREVLGKVNDTYMVGGSIIFEGEIDPQERSIINKIKRGYIGKVSIFADVDKLVKESIQESDGKVSTCYKAIGLNFRELSLVSVPGIDEASIDVDMLQAVGESFNAYNVEEIEKNEDIMESVLKDDKKNINNLKGENIMDAKFEEKISVLEKQNSDLKKELEVFVTEKKIIEEAERIEKLVSAKIAEIMKVQESEEESKDEPKEEKVEEEKVEGSEEEKKDESKGIVDGEKEEKSEASEKLGDEFLKNTVIERDGNGMSFYMIRGESK